MKVAGLLRLGCERVYHSGFPDPGVGLQGGLRIRNSMVEEDRGVAITQPALTDSTVGTLP